MTTPTARALSIQEQQAQEIIAESVYSSSAALFLRAVNGEITQQQFDREYKLLLSGAMAAVSQARIAYLQQFAVASGKDRFQIPSRVLTPTPRDVLADSATPEGLIRHVDALREKWFEEILPVQKDLLDDTMRRAAETKARAQSTKMAANRFASLAESTVTSTADYTTREVLGPDRRVAALRRVVHPGACDRCVTVAKVLVFKTLPSLRHDQCRCSFEPVFSDDPAYQARIGLYRRNSVARPGSMTEDGLVTRGSRLARDTRYRGRQQLKRAQALMDEESVQEMWAQYLRADQVRLGQMVKTVKSNSYRDWAVMVSAEQSKIGRGLLPIITRN